MLALEGYHLAFLPTPAWSLCNRQVHGLKSLFGGHVIILSYIGG